MRAGKVTGKAVFRLCMLLFFCVTFHADWKANGLLWWGSIGLLGAGYLFHRKGKMAVKISRFDAWWLGFTAVAALSASYAYSPDAAMDSVKTFAVMFLSMYLIGKPLKSKDAVESVLSLLLASLFCIVIYIYLFVDLESFLLTRVGRAYTGRWNTNDVGIMATVGILLSMHFLRGQKSTFRKILLLLCIAAFAYMDLITASRKALLMLLFGVCAHLLLQNPKKLGRNIVWIILIVGLSYLAVMEIPTLYDWIGWRMQGMLDGLAGKPTADSSTIHRKKMLEAAVQVFYDHPLFGCGMDNFRFYNPIRITYAHNHFAEMAADLGILGLISYYWIFVYIIIDYFKRIQKDALLTTLFIFVVMYFISHYAMVATTDMIQHILLCSYLAYSRVHKKEAAAQGRKNIHPSKEKPGGTP